MYAPALLQRFVEEQHGGMFMGLHWVWWIVWLAIGAVLIRALARILVEPRDHLSPSDTARRNAEEILRARHARGEISDEEFTARARALRRSR